MQVDTRVEPGHARRATRVVEIVTEAGPQIGFGHVGRCAALWEALGDDAAFAVDDDDARAFLTARGAAVGGAPRAPVVVVDRRAPVTVEEVCALQAAGRAVCLLDDGGPGRRVADLVIDPPTAASWPPAGGRRLSGFEHVLLRREITTVEPDPVPGRVLLGIGGSDMAGLTPVLARGLAEAGIEPEVALGPGYRGERPEHGRVLPSPAAWPEALGSASLLVAGYGHSLLEAAYLGVPAIAAVYLHEHLEHAAAFCENGTALMIDMADGASPAELAALVTELLDDEPRRRAMSARGRELVDGRGAERIAAALRELA